MWFVRDSALAGTAVIHCFNTLNNCSTSITNQPTNQLRGVNEVTMLHDTIVGDVILDFGIKSVKLLGPLLLTWFNLNPSMNR